MRRPVIALIVVALGLPVSVFVAGEVLSRPAHESVGSPPSDLDAVAVAFHTTAGLPVAGWMVRGTPGAGAVLLLHGVHGDRRRMVGRARFLGRLGYSVLLIDLPGHGESGGARITFGSIESQGVNAALSFMRQELPAERIGVIGVSLGAASLVLSRPEVDLSAVVLESMFPTIREAVSNRLDTYLGAVGEALTPVLLSQLPLRLGISADELRPIVELPSIHVPLLVASGSIDRSTTLEETERIYAAARAPKELWVVEGAAHVDLHAFDSKVYEERVSTFLARYLRRSG